MSKFKVGDYVRVPGETAMPRATGGVYPPLTGIVRTVYTPERDDVRNTAYDVEEITGWHLDPKPTHYPGWYYHEDELEAL